MRSLTMLMAVGLAALAACSSQPERPPLPIKQTESGGDVAIDSSLALVSGRLNIAEDGKSKIPYEIGTDAGCVAGVTAAAIVLFPLWVLSGGPALSGPNPNCESVAPALVLVHLETRKAAPLFVGEQGAFLAQLPPGTYLVPEVDDDDTPIVATMAFQVREPGRAYYLGDVALDYSVRSGGVEIRSLAVNDNYDSGRATRLAGLPAAQAQAEERVLLARFAGYPGAAYFRGSDGDKKWNAYLDMVIADLDARGIHLLTAAPIALPPTDRDAVKASFEQRRRQIEAKWAKIIADRRRFYCTGYGAAPPCNVVRDAEAERDAELKALDEEHRMVMGSE